MRITSNVRIKLASFLGHPFNSFMFNRFTRVMFLRKIKIAAIFELHQKEIALTHHLLTEKHNLYSGIISKLIN